MSTAVVNANGFSRNPRLVIYDGDSGRRFDERRRSPRVTLAKPLPCFLAGVGPATIQSLSLGGATLESSFRPRPKSSCRMRLVYGDVCVDTDTFIYRTVVHELFYSAKLGSRVRFLSSAMFVNPSVAALNLIYRILGEHWVDSGDDDTTPAEP